jgi:hypothetical protein
MKKPSKYNVFIVFVVLVVAGNHTCTGGPINSKSVEMTINDFHKKLFKIPSDAFCNQASIQEHPRLKADRLTSCGRPLPGGKISAVIIFFLSEIWATIQYPFYRILYCSIIVECQLNSPLVVYTNTTK